MLKDAVGQGKILWWKGFWNSLCFLEKQEGEEAPLDLPTKDRDLENEARDVNYMCQCG